MLPLVHLGPSSMLGWYFNQLDFDTVAYDQRTILLEYRFWGRAMSGLQVDKYCFRGCILPGNLTWVCPKDRGTSQSGRRPFGFPPNQPKKKGVTLRLMDEIHFAP